MISIRCGVSAQESVNVSFLRINIKSCCFPTVTSKHIRWWREASGNNQFLTDVSPMASGYQTACRQQREEQLYLYYGLTFSIAVLHHQPLGASSQSQWLCTCFTSKSVSCSGNFLLQNCSSSAMAKMRQHAMPVMWSVEKAGCGAANSALVTICLGRKIAGVFHNIN